MQKTSTMEGYGFIRSVGMIPALIASTLNPASAQQEITTPQNGVYSLGREACIVKDVIVECMYDIHGLPASTYNLNGTLKTVTFAFPSSEPPYDKIRTAVVNIVPSSQKEKFSGVYVSDAFDLGARIIGMGDLETMVFYATDDSNFAKTWRTDDRNQKNLIIQPENLLKR